MNLIDKIKEVLREYKNIKAAVIFGSFARGGKVFGDIDVLVVGRDLNESELEEKLSSITGKVFDIHILTPEEILERMRENPQYFIPIFSYGIVLKGKKYLNNLSILLRNILRGGEVISRREVVIWRR